MYENIIAKAIEKDIKILGISLDLLGSEKYSHPQSQNFKNNIMWRMKRKFWIFQWKKMYM